MTRTSDELSTEQIISALSHLSLPELEEVFDHLLALQAERKAPHLSASESALLLRVNQGLPSELRDRITLLRTKFEDGSITDAEDDELTRLIDQAEQLHVERMAALGELSKLRGVRLPVLMDQLGIHFPENA